MQDIRGTFLLCSVIEVGKIAGQARNDVGAQSANLNHVGVIPAFTEHRVGEDKPDPILSFAGYSALHPAQLGVHPQFELSDNSG